LIGSKIYLCIEYF